MGISITSAKTVFTWGKKKEEDVDHCRGGKVAEGLDHDQGVKRKEGTKGHNIIIRIRKRKREHKSLNGI